VNGLSCCCGNIAIDTEGDVSICLKRGLSWPPASKDRLETEERDQWWPAGHYLYKIWIHYSICSMPLSPLQITPLWVSLGKSIAKHSQPRAKAWHLNYVIRLQNVERNPGHLQDLQDRYPPDFNRIITPEFFSSLTLIIL